MTPFPLLRRDSAVLAVLLMLSVLVAGVLYYPGLHGPYVFDDHGNLLENDYLRVASLDIGVLWQAAFSLDSGMLHRPISVLSFAFNYYFAGGFANVAAFKATNIAIHALNGVLIFILTRLLVSHLPGSCPSLHRRENSKTVLAGIVALLWLVHPIQLTSVLYVTQRMTSLSALFVLFGLILYLKGRQRLAEGRPRGRWLIALGLGGGGALGILSKENAVLLPLYVLIIELALFRHESSWRRWQELTTGMRLLYAAMVLAGVLALMVGAVLYALPEYAERPFTLMERLLTEARVLLFYLSLILVPRLDALGLQHDDIALSTSLLTPWTTLPAVIGLVALFLFGIFSVKKLPLIGLGVLWFFAAHALESTILPLELAHEHRNYLAVFGVMLAVAAAVAHGADRTGRQWWWALLPALLVAFSGVTYARAAQWSDAHTLHTFEALHHPESPRAQAGLGMVLASVGRPREAIAAFDQAAVLNSTEPAYPLLGMLVAAEAGIAVDTERIEHVRMRLATGSITPFTRAVLQRASLCLTNVCNGLRAPMEYWLNALIARASHSGSRDLSLYYLLLGRCLASHSRIGDAERAYRRSHQLDPQYLHPLIELGWLYVHAGDSLKSAEILEQLKQASAGNPHPRDREIAMLSAAVRRTPPEKTPGISP